MSADTGERPGYWARHLPTLHLLVPLVLDTGLAMTGQVIALLGITESSGWPLGARIALSIAASAGFESLSLSVQWHAHDELLRNATLQAARRRLASYGLAIGAALLQWWHFSDHWAPTPLAFMFAVFSVMSPWLWGMHTRRRQAIILAARGTSDTHGAVFGLSRWFAFPLVTPRVWRHSIDTFTDDPRAAWESWKATRKAEATAATGPEPPPTPVVAAEPVASRVAAAATSPATVRAQARPAKPATPRRRDTTSGVLSAKPMPGETVEEARRRYNRDRQAARRAARKVTA
jgi:hypothetical protein